MEETECDKENQNDDKTITLELIAAQHKRQQWLEKETPTTNEPQAGCELNKSRPFISSINSCCLLVVVTLLQTEVIAKANTRYLIQRLLTFFS